MHPQFDAFRGTPCDAEQLDAIAEFFGVTDILFRQFRYAFGVDLVELHRNAERNGRHDGELVRRIDTLDVERRVGFRITEFLRLSEDLAET